MPARLAQRRGRAEGVRIFSEMLEWIMAKDPALRKGLVAGDGLLLMRLYGEK
jgi:hypothetical protein